MRTIVAPALCLSLLALAAAPAMAQPNSLPKPAPRQLAWQKLEYYAFTHFGPNTFSGKEWGDGREDPRSFNPTQFDARQWAKTFKDAGMKGIVITAKHHDGFCLWPSKYSTHTVAQSPWKNGKGDILREVSDACREFGLKFGVYLSPWDRNHPKYGTPEYNEIFAKTLEEVLTQYGPVFEVWFDGANGEGPNGKKQVYDWKLFIDTVRKHQPNAVIFSDAGPDIRWIGNESGFAGETNWSTLDRDRFVPGDPKYKELTSGHENGTHWLPGEVDVSIRPGWFWRAAENDKVKSVDHLEKIYYESVGRNANLLLNVPPDDRGLIHENDVQALMALRKRLDATFRRPVEAGKPFDVIQLTEDIRTGQRVKSFTVEGRVGERWTKLAEGTTIGAKRLLRIPETKVEEVRVTTKAKPGPVKVDIKTFASPNVSSRRRERQVDPLAETKAQRDARMEWFREARFGMFIHWGLYSIPAGTWNGKNYGGASEWLINSAQVKPADWMPLKDQFNPVNFDAKRWVQIAKDAGMKYIVITSKHHEGFAMWPTEGTWDIGDTKFKRDPLKELADECKKQGIKLCFYHSILDWTHPDYLPRRSWDDRPASAANYERYVAFMKNQLKELLTKYGPIGILWFDGEWDSTWTHERGLDLYRYVRSFQPDLIVNNRVGKGRAGMSGMDEGQGVGDYGTPEQEIPSSGIPGLDWESCMTMNGSWGFHANDHNWKSSLTLIENLVDCASKGGNYLLNVGPTSLGEIPGPSIERLAEVGKWLKRNGEAVYGTQAGPFPKALPWGKVTRKGNRLYLVRFGNETVLTLPGLKTSIRSAAALNGPKLPIRVTQNAIQVPPKQGEDPDVFVVELAGEPVVEETPLSVRPDGGIDLMAADALIQGGAKFEGGAKQAIGFWTSQGDVVRWTYEAPKAQEYDVEIELACEDGSEGSEVELKIGASATKFSVPNTGGWDKFIRVKVGRAAAITPGKTTLEIRAIRKPGVAVMNLRAVRLTARGG